MMTTFLPLSDGFMIIWVLVFKTIQGLDWGLSLDIPCILDLRALNSSETFLQNRLKFGFILAIGNVVDLFLRCLVLGILGPTDARAPKSPHHFAPPLYLM